MSLSIRTRTILLLNLVVIGLAVAFGWLAGRVAGQVVEDRLVREVLRNTSQFLNERHLPFNDNVMQGLKRIFDLDFAVIRAANGAVMGTSLPAADRALLTRAVQAGRRPLAGAYAGRWCRVDDYNFSAPVTGQDAPEALRLFAFAPQSHFAEARHRAAWLVAGFTVPAVLVVTVLAFVFSWTVTRPLSLLACEMDLRAAAAGPAAAGALDLVAAAPVARPREIARLAESFHHLLGKLRQAQDRLAAAERLATLGRLSATIAHELKNPLSGIKMNLRVLRDELERRQVKDPSLEVIGHEIDRMDLFLQELMMLARPDGTESAVAQMIPGNVVPVALDKIVDSVLALMAARYDHVGVTVAREFQPVPAVLANSGRVRQVIMNLLVNALEAMPAGGTVRLCIAPGSDGRVRCAVTDSGSGIQAADDVDMFAPFYSSKPGSAGLGLYVCRRIMDGLGGRIGGNNVAGGACFWFELPTA
ncbi:MAG: ATP-binding protein [bacterium]